VADHRSGRLSLSGRRAVGLNRPHDGLRWVRVRTRDNAAVDVRAIPGQEHLPWAEVWFRAADEAAWREASRKARALGKTGLEVWTTDEHPDVVAFFGERDYAEVRRYLRFALDVGAAPDPGEPQWELATLADRPELLQQAYEVACETYVDQPGREDASLPALERWRSFAYDANPKDAFVVALAGSEVVGFGFLSVEGDEGDHGMTAVARAWRGRGIADAIKRAHVRWAKANGLTTLRTANEVRIPAIRRLSERYGYQPEPAEIVMRGPLAPPD
jgi:GNAT superfamily N-acetyltransferase